MRISAVIITYNEEENIARCLSSLLSVADEIVVVDSFSTDNTRKIVSEFKGVKFFSCKWLGYAAQKNYANSLATNNTILSIDADEVLSPELQQSIKELKEKDETIIRVYEVSRLTNYCGSWIKHCGWYPDKRVRIFNKKNSQWQGEFVHETLKVEPNPEVVHLKGDLLHYSYKNTSDHIIRIDKYSSLSAQEAHKNGKTTSVIGVVFRPLWRFLRDYCFKLGFLDGFAGYRVCRISAISTFLKYSKLMEMQNSAKKQS